VWTQYQYVIEMQHLIYKIVSIFSLQGGHFYHSTQVYWESNVKFLILKNFRHEDKLRRTLVLISCKGLVVSIIIIVIIIFV